MASNSELDTNWYEVLHLHITASNEEINKAARKLSLKYHPDKTDAPDAPKKFERVQLAKAILLDEAKRKEIDEKLRSKLKRKEHEDSRNQHMNDKRKKFATDLARKEEAARQTSSHGSHQHARKEDGDGSEHKKHGHHHAHHGHKKHPQYDEKILESFRSDAQARKESFMDESQQEEERRAKEFYMNREMMADESSSVAGSNQIKFKWRKSAKSHSDDTLYQLLKVYGPIENILMSDSHGTSATITFKDIESALKAEKAFDMSEEFKVKVIPAKVDKKNQKADIFTHVYGSQSGTGASKQQQQQQPSSHYSDELANEARRAAERERMIRSLEQQGEDADEMETFASFYQKSGSSADQAHKEEADVDVTASGSIPSGFSDSVKSVLTSVSSLEELNAKEALVLKRMREFAMAHSTRSSSNNNIRQSA
jgi:curved DNA-binding protein CbpA